MARIFALLCLVAATATAADRPNVLFIAVDDLRPELGCYGAAHIKSPNIDRLASAGLVFNRAYCQQAVCNPSRASLLSGLRPDTIRVWDLPTNLRHHKSDLVTLPQRFKQAGYRTERIGKIYHVGHGNTDDAPSWSNTPDWNLKPRFGPAGEDVIEQLRREARERGDRNARIRGLPIEAPDIADGDLRDGSIADGAIGLLEEFKKKNEPFFLAVGFMNPHLPFVSPKKYWELYDRSKIAVPDKSDPADIPSMSLSGWGELRQYVGIPKRGDVTDEQARELIHGYYAAVSYVDAQVGRLLDTLERLGLADNTIVILWGDHGWKLGEYGDWCKHTNMELDTRVPLIIRAPGMKAPGSKSDALVEFVDIYPSLCELAGVEAPGELDGHSFAPLLDSPDRPWKTAAFSQYPRGNLMGYSMRTADHHLVRWVKKGDRDGEPVAVELYDHAKDPGETRNVAGDPAYAQTLAELTERCKEGPTGPPIADSTRRPNIVLVLSDDQTYHDAGCYGNADVKTPNIDKLATQGMRFDRCFTATAMCAPTRQQLYTGVFPVRNGAYPNHSQVFKGTRSLVHHFEALGYRVGLAGKSHIGPRASFPFKSVAMSTDKLKAFIDSDPDQPYFLVVASHHPHKPWKAGDASAYDAAKLKLPPYLPDTPATRSELAAYYAEVTEFDAELGRVMDVVDGSGRADDTIFIYTSEQGSNFTHCKWTCYDTGLRTGLVIRWPGHVKAGSSTHAMVQYVDIVPTLLEAAGADPATIDTGRPGAPDGGNGFDGRSFLAVLRGKADTHRDVVYGVHTTRGIINGNDSYPIRSIRDARYKYIRNLSHEAAFTNIVTGRGSGDYFDAWREAAATDPLARKVVHDYQHRPAEELYDLETDPFEMNNLADDPAHRDRMNALGAKLDAWMTQQGDRGVDTEKKADNRQ